MMTVLGIETSTKVCSVGLLLPDGSRTERSLVESHIHSEKLLTLAQEICSEDNIALTQLNAIAVSSGPGSFTGLRIGLSTAQGLSLALNIPLFPIPSFGIFARAALDQQKEYSSALVVIDAKQGDHYVGVFHRDGGEVQEQLPVSIRGVSSLQELIQPDMIVLTDCFNIVSEQLGTNAIVEVFPYCRGDVVALMAEEQIKSGKNAGSRSLEPLYLKDFIVRSPEKRQ